MDMKILAKRMVGRNAHHAVGGLYIYSSAAYWISHLWAISDHLLICFREREKNPKTINHEAGACSPIINNDPRKGERVFYADQFAGNLWYSRRIFGIIVYLLSRLGDRPRKLSLVRALRITKKSGISRGVAISNIHMMRTCY